jgi:Iap family predicted aminopeptidase
MPSTTFPQERAFWDTLDAAYLFDFAEHLSSIGTYELGFRPSGSKAGHRATDLILQEMHTLGLQDVHTEPFPVYAWDFGGASLEIDGWDPMPASSFPPTPGTPPEGLSAALVDAGNGTVHDYLGLDAKDKIAFVRFDTQRLPWVDVLAHEAELHGARALAFFYLNGYAQHASGEALNTHDGIARPTIPILQLSKRDGIRVAEQLARGPTEVTIRSEVHADPTGTGYSVIAKIPGRLEERYLIVGAHYDAWFHGYWDNAAGVAGMLTIAKTLLESDYQPEHTLLFVATDAEEFGAPDTSFDWLIGCYHLLKSHPEWRGRVSAAFNIDTLAFLNQEQLGFIGPPELLSFLRQAINDAEIKTFPKPDIWIKDQITAWTETLTYAYFGVPPIQPRFALEEAKQTIYHTQFDDRDVVHHARAAETAQLYGALLVRLDRQPILPYDFIERVQRLRARIEPAPGTEADEERALLRDALERLENRAETLNQLLAEKCWDAVDPSRDDINDRLRQATSHLIRNINYLNPDSPEDALPLHVFYDRDLRAIDAALAHVVAGDAQKAIAALTDGKGGLLGAWYALETSYPVYYRHVINATNPGRKDLFWGQGRTAALTDAWPVLHSLQDKLARGVADLAAEENTLRQKRNVVAQAYRAALKDLARVLDEAVALLPV